MISLVNHKKHRNSKTMELRCNFQLFPIGKKCCEVYFITFLPFWM